MVNKVVFLSLKRVFQLFYSSCGLFMLFIIVGTTLKKQPSQLPYWIIKVGALCMGVYLLQQFILVGLYEYTTLPSLLGCYYLPWVGFVVALSSSLFISKILVKTKVGKFLIG